MERKESIFPEIVIFAPLHAIERCARFIIERVQTDVPYVIPSDNDQARFEE